MHRFSTVLLTLVALAALSMSAASPALAKPAPKKKPAETAAPDATAKPASGAAATSPVVNPTPAPAADLPPPVAPGGSHADDSGKSDLDAAHDQLKKDRDSDDGEEKKSQFEGFFLNLNLGYATSGGRDGPDIPALSVGGNDPPAGTPSVKATASAYPDKYKRAITTDKGAGLAIAIQIGYNIKGYVSLWADISGHGSFGSSLDTAGVGTGAVMVGFHPLRFVKKGQLPVDTKLYGGFGFFEILGYQEAEFQIDAKGKAWLGTSIPFGLATEYKFDKKGAFAMGLDLRFVAASYDKWVYNNDKDISSKLTTPETTFRFEPRVMFGWHF